MDEAIIKKAREKFEYKPLKNYGFCIKVLGIKASQGHTQEGEILYQLTLEILGAHFFESELLYGRIISCTSEGVIIQFYENSQNKNHIKTFVPKIKLLENSQFDADNKVWRVIQGKKQFIYYIGLVVRFQIDIIDNEEAKSDDQIILSRMNVRGLGGIEWWGVEGKK